MLINYLKIAFRNISRNKGSSFINIFSLAIGMAATILIMLFVNDELSFDKYHEKSERIVRITRAWVNQDGETSLHLGNVAPPFGPLLSNDFENVVLHAVRFLGDNPLITYNDTNIEEQRVFLVDGDVFDIFSWPLVKGDPATALIEPNSIVMTETTAKKYFGDEDPLGKMVNYDNLTELKVTGIARDVPLNSHFNWDMLASLSTYEAMVGRDRMMQSWGSNNYTTYLLLPEGYDYKKLQSQLPDFLDRHLQPTSNGRKPSEYNYLTLWPLTSIHLHSHLDSEVEANGDIAYVYIYTIIALFILVIACINFINLSTARSSKRAQEVGLRKVMGAYKSTLVRQFLVESVLFAILGMSLAIILVYWLLPTFNEFIGKGLALNFSKDAFTLAMIGGITLITGVAAGSYPAFYLASFNPASILKGKGKVAGSRFSMRSILVIIQFTISIALIVGVGVVQHQLSYMLGKDLGFNKDRMVILPINTDIYNKYASIKQQLESQPGIESVSISSRIPSGRLLDSQGTVAEVDGEMKQISFRVADVHVDHGFLENFKISFIAGRNFDFSRASDSTEAFVINEAAVKAIGWETPKEAIDKKFNYGGRQGRIIGIVKDFHFESLHQQIAPIVFLVSSGRARNIAIRIKEGHQDEVMAYLQEQWAFLRPGFPFSSYFVGDRFDQLYAEEDRLSIVVKVFSLLAIFIASMGLYALSSYIAEQRLKEIGVRKVLGASVVQIVVLLTKGITWLVLFSFVIAGPLAYFVMTNWLENFAYHDNIQLTPFIISLVFSLLIAWVTISIQTIRASLMNPVDTLRYE